MPLLVKRSSDFQTCFKILHWRERRNQSQILPNLFSFRSHHNDCGKKHSNKNKKHNKKYCSQYNFLITPPAYSYRKQIDSDKGSRCEGENADIQLLRLSCGLIWQIAIWIPKNIFLGHTPHLHGGKVFIVECHIHSFPSLGAKTKNRHVVSRTMFCYCEWATSWPPVAAESTGWSTTEERDSRRQAPNDIVAGWFPSTT